MAAAIGLSAPAQASPSRPSAVPMPKASTVSTSVTQVLVDVGVAEEPVADAAEDHQRLAEEERGLALVLEDERRNQPGVSACQSPKTSTSTASCHSRRLPGRGLIRFQELHAASCCW